MISNEYVKSILLNNGIDDDYLEVAGIEGGSEEWMGVLSDITGKNSYEDDFSDDDNDKIVKFINTMKKMGIYLW